MTEPGVRSAKSRKPDTHERLKGTWATGVPSPTKVQILPVHRFCVGRERFRSVRRRRMAVGRPCWRRDGFRMAGRQVPQLRRGSAAPRLRLVPSRGTSEACLQDTVVVWQLRSSMGPLGRSSRSVAARRTASESQTVPTRPVTCRRQSAVPAVDVVESGPWWSSPLPSRAPREARAGCCEEVAVAVSG